MHEIEEAEGITADFRGIREGPVHDIPRAGRNMCTVALGAVCFA